MNSSELLENLEQIFVITRNYWITIPDSGVWIMNKWSYEICYLVMNGLGILFYRIISGQELNKRSLYAIVLEQIVFFIEGYYTLMIDLFAFCHSWRWVCCLQISYSCHHLIPSVAAAVSTHTVVVVGVRKELLDNLLFQSTMTCTKSYELHHGGYLPWWILSIVDTFYCNLDIQKHLLQNYRKYEWKISYAVPDK